jgi:transposase InsO family protein
MRDVANQASYGSPRVRQDLRALAHRVSCKRVARLMRQEGLAARKLRRYKATTNSRHSRPVAPNVVARKFHATAPNRLWVTDITYVWTWEGWLFVAAILDVFSHRVVGWSVPQASSEYDGPDRPAEGPRPRQGEYGNAWPAIIH